MQITLPHNLNNLTPYQIRYLGTKKRFAILVWHRRARKTRTALNRQVMRIMERKEPGVAYYVLPTYKQAKQVIWDTLVGDHIPDAIVEKKNDSELAIYYKNGVIQRFIGAENPDAHRGTNPFDVVFDEFSEMPEEIWTAIFQPVLRENKGTATFVFTPKGKNHSYQLLERAKLSEEWYWDVKSVNDTNTFAKEELEEIRRNTPSALYDQEYLCAFLDGAGQVFRNHRNLTYDPLMALPMEGDFKLGVDLAKYQDWTVITPFNLNSMTAYPQDRFNQADWLTQEGRVEAIYRRFNAQRMTIDATGVGDPIVEALQRRGLNIGEEDAFKFTETSRENLLRHLAVMLEQGRIRIPNDPGLLDELDYFRWEITKGGKVRMAAPENLHDDRVMSLALALHGVSEPLPRTSNNAWVPDEPLYKSIGI